jgi:alcohol dehydrogenase (cytochrome c)
MNLNSSFRLSLHTVLAFGVCVSAFAASGPSQQELNDAEARSDWILPNHDYGSQRFVGLKEINSANAAKLRAVCIYQAADTSGFLTNPLMYGDTLYVTTGVSTIALDATTCKARWRHDWKAKGLEIAPTSRGAAIKDGKVIRGTNDGYLIALDAGTGQSLWSGRFQRRRSPSRSASSHSSSMT